MDSHKLANICAEFILEKKGESVRILDLRDITDIADYFVIASATSATHMKAIVEYLDEKLRKKRIIPWHIEGVRAMQWVVVDLVDVVVHIFLPSVREFYDIESLWGDAPVETVGE